MFKNGTVSSTSPTPIITDTPAPTQVITPAPSPVTTPERSNYIERYRRFLELLKRVRSIRD
jgi:hypothetical protein